MANDGGNTVPRITKSEHIGPDDTGDNIQAKRVANYVWNNGVWERATPASGGGGGTQYTDGSSTPANPTGTIPVFDDAGTITSVSTANPLPVDATFSGTVEASPTFKEDPTDSGESPKYGKVDAQGNVQVDVVSSALPSGAATAANQQNDALTDAELRATPVDVDTGLTQPTTPSDTQPVSAAALPLPSGASTSAKQDTGNTSLASIDGKITAVNTGAVVVSSSALPSGAATSAKQPALGTAGTPSTDVITVQGRASMTPILTDGSATTQPVSGTVTVTGVATAAKQDTGNASLSSIDGKITEVDTGAVVVASSALPSGAATATIQSDGSQKTQIVDAGGEAVTVTGGKLDVNATASLAGETLPIAGATEAVGVAIVDGSGDQITSFGGGTQYSDGDAEADPTGTVAMGTDGTNVFALHTDTAGDLQVDVVSSALPSGAATSAKQDTVIGHLDGVEGLLATIDADTGTLAGAVAGTEMQVDIVSSALPSGAATGAKQDTGNASLASIDGKITAVDTGAVTIAALPNEGQQTMANSISVAVASNQTALPVDGSGVTQPVSNAGLTELAAAINSSKVDVNIVSSDVATGGTSAADDADFTAGTTPGTPSMGVYESTPTSVTDGDLGTVGITEGRRLKTSATLDAALPAGNNNIGDVDVASIVPGTSATNLGKAEDAVHASGDTGVMPLAVRHDNGTALAANGDYVPLTTDPNGYLWVNIGDSGADLEVTSFQGGAWNVVTTINNALPAGANNIGSVDIASSELPTGASTSAKQDTIIGHLDGVEAAVELLDDTVAVLGTDTYTEASSKGLVIGAVRRDADTTLVNTTNEVAPLQVDANGRLKVEVFSGETLPVSGTVTANLAAGNNNIGDVDVATLPVAFNTGTRSATTQRVSVATDDIVQVAGTIAHDSADSGNPVKIGGKAVSTVPTAVTANDRVDGFFDLQGRQIVAAKAATGTQTTVAGSASNVTLLAANTARLGAILYNDSTAICYVRLQATATTSNFTYKMQPDSTLEIPFGYTGIIDGIWASATGNMRVTEVA